jgi:hypothetical protein
MAITRGDFGPPMQHLIDRGTDSLSQTISPMLLPR